MQQANLILIVLVGAMFAPVRSTLAHHSRAMFDVSRNATYRGVVQEYRWQNPHCHIVIVGTDADTSRVGTWDIEASSISLMASMGCNRRSFKAGDRITVVAHPSFKGSKDVLLFYAVKADGTRLFRATHRYPSEAE